jgi:hypothetical protein
MNPAARVRAIKSIENVADVEDLLRLGGLSGRKAKAAAGAAWRTINGANDEDEAEARLGLNVKRPGALFYGDVAAAYTFYLIHMTVIYVIATVIGHALDLHLVYWIVVAVGLPVTLAVHRYLVAPSPVLSLIFNGKVRKQAKPLPVQPAL